MSEHHDHHEEPLVLMGKYKSLALLIGGIGAIVLIYGLIAGGKPAWQGYLFGWLVWASLSIGCLGLMLLKHTVNGKWGLPVIRLLEAGASFTNFLFLFVAFLPMIYSVLAGDLAIYPWANAEKIHADHVLHMKAWWLNQPAFAIRTILYFGIWMFMAAGLRASTLRQDVSKDDKERARRTNWSAPGLVVFGLSVTFAFTDWVMSLEPYWFSTIYGAWWMVGASLMAFAFVTLIATLNKQRDPYRGPINSGWTRDMGNLLLAFTMLWGYTSLSQYLIIWSGNLPEFTTYFINRSKDGWNAVGMSTLFGQFFIPFFCLLSPRVKAQAPLLAKVCGLILVFRLVDMYQVIVPSMSPVSVVPSLWMIVSFAGLGGLWFYGFSKSAAQAPLMPSYDPRIQEAAHAH